MSIDLRTTENTLKMPKNTRQKPSRSTSKKYYSRSTQLLDGYESSDFYVHPREPFAVICDGLVDIDHLTKYKDEVKTVMNRNTQYDFTSKWLDVFYRCLNSRLPDKNYRILLSYLLHVRMALYTVRSMVHHLLREVDELLLKYIPSWVIYNSHQHLRIRFPPYVYENCVREMAFKIHVLTVYATPIATDIPENTPIAFESMCL